MIKLEKLLSFLISSSLVLKALRYIMTLRPSLAKRLIGLTSRPSGNQKRYIRSIHNEHWEGVVIMPEISSCTEEAAIDRLKNADIVIFYIHGGGFRAGHCTMFMKSFITWINIMKQKHGLNVGIMSVKYGLAPEYVYPVPLLQCVKAYNHLIQDLGVSPSKIIVSGDSAGGCNAIETLIRTYAAPMLNDINTPRMNFEMGLPAAAILISPLVSSNDASISWKLYQDTDVVSRKLRQLVFDEYIFTPDSKIDDLQLLRLSSVRTDFKRFLPKQVMFFVGGVETMRDDILEMASAIERDGTRNITVIQEDYPHDWFVIWDLLPEQERHLIDKYNEQFVDFAVRAVRTYADENMTSNTPSTAIQPEHHLRKDDLETVVGQPEIDKKVCLPNNNKHVLL